MSIEYTSLRILEALAKARSHMSLEDLRAELARRGFAIDASALANRIRDLRSKEMVEALVLAGDASEFGGVAITEKGDRKVRSIVRL